MAQITRINLVPVSSEIGSLRAIVDLTFDDEFTVKGFKVIETDEGLIVGLPAERTKSGQWRDRFVPASPKVFDEISAEILYKFEPLSSEEEKSVNEDPSEEMTESHALETPEVIEQVAYVSDDFEPLPEAPMS